MSAHPEPSPDPSSSNTLVWIDAREAVIVGWRDDQAFLQRVESEVPAHRRSTGHVRHVSTMRHGGGGATQTAGEPHRLEHLRQFVGDIGDRVAPDGDVLILGPGTVCEHLERLIREQDEHHGRARVIRRERSSRVSDRQLIARLRTFAGVEPHRRMPGSARVQTRL